MSNTDIGYSLNINVWQHLTNQIDNIHVSGEYCFQFLFYLRWSQCVAQVFYLSVNLVDCCRFTFFNKFNLSRIVVTSTRCFPSLFWAKWVFKEQQGTNTKTYLLSSRDTSMFNCFYTTSTKIHWRGEDNSSILELNTNIDLISVVGQDELVRQSSSLFKKLLQDELVREPPPPQNGYF